ncbi:hypothetical protein MF672_027900 [Actinomadura sp. ATCC 31491]|uniref:Uncharacterized protein n=1 Tax=Actinomadura luzonensis TaxID=2805427 RepID=A0ABT0G0C3_9ACTN|nr:hypothetical protein [Actinomadura luzonensis]MCK2217588.1 hypothetical protein [Actinomadura luzonensis]
MAFVIPEIKVGLAEFGGGQAAWCAKCGKRATLYIVDSASGSPVYACTEHVGAEIEAMLLHSAD